MAEIKSLGSLGDDVRPVNVVGLGASAPSGASNIFGLGSAHEDEPRPTQRPQAVGCPPGCVPAAAPQRQPSQGLGLQRIPTSGSPIEDVPGVPHKDSLMDRDVEQLGDQLEEAAQKLEPFVVAGKKAFQNIKQARARKQSRKVLAEEGIDVIREPSVFEKIKLKLQPKSQELAAEKRNIEMRELGIDIL